MVTALVSDDALWGNVLWKHPSQLTEEVNRTNRKLVTMIYSMKRASNSRRKVLMEALEIMTEMKMNSSVNATLTMRDSLKIQTMRNTTYFQYVLSDLDGELMEMPRMEAGQKDSQPKKDLKARIWKWEDHEAEEETE